MKNKILGVCVYLLFSVYSYAQNTKLTIKVIEQATQESLIGADVYLEELKIGGITNEDGLAVLESIPIGKYTISISYLGFETLEEVIDVSTTEWTKTYSLNPVGMQLEGLTINTTRSSRTIKKIPTRIEFIGGEELEEKALMNAANISMVLRESTGVQIQQTSLSSANSSIRIQGLDGRYTQILKDGFPLFGGFSGGLSINQIPPVDLQQFEIIKGSSSTLYGGGAISGLVNLVSKTPDEEPEFTIQLANTHVGGNTANVFFSKKKNKWGYTLYGSGHTQKLYDPDNDEFSNIPNTKTLSFNPKVFYYPSDSETIWLGLNGTIDQREGGDLIAITEGVSEDHIYKEKNTSTRISAQAVYEKGFSDNKRLQIKNSISYFNRKLTTPDIYFSGKQLDVFSEINYSIQKEKADWVFGGNFYNNSFEEEDSLLPRDQANTTFGVFANNTTDVNESWILESGFRTDYVPDWGTFYLPRVSLLWKASDTFTSRLGGGLGYKIPDIFTEEATVLNFKNVLPIDKSLLYAERSYGANIDFNLKGNISENVKYAINQLFYLTSIDNALLLNRESSGNYSFSNADGAVLSRGAETNLKLTFHDFKWFLNYAYINATLNYLPNNPQKTLTPKHQAGSVLMYENSKWRLGFETYYTGSQRLSSNEYTSDFFTMGLLVQRHFKWGSPYVNFENFTDRRQSRFSPETLPPHQNPQFAEIYAPTDGFVFTAGVIINPFGRKEEH